MSEFDRILSAMVSGEEYTARQIAVSLWLSTHTVAPKLKAMEKRGMVKRVLTTSAQIYWRRAA